MYRNKNEKNILLDNAQQKDSNNNFDSLHKSDVMRVVPNSLGLSHTFVFGNLTGADHFENSGTLRDKCSNKALDGDIAKTKNAVVDCSATAVMSDSSPQLDNARALIGQSAAADVAPVANDNHHIARLLGK
jgi:hypothetical protein